MFPPKLLLLTVTWMTVSPLPWPSVVRSASPRVSRGASSPAQSVAAAFSGAASRPLRMPAHPWSWLVASRAVSTRSPAWSRAG